MRPKTLKLVVTFHTTAAAMAMEALCKEQSLPGRLIPTPRELTADCGMALQNDRKKALASYHLPHHLRGHGHGAAVSGGGPCRASDPRPPHHHRRLRPCMAGRAVPAAAAGGSDPEHGRGGLLRAGAVRKHRPIRQGQDGAVFCVYAPLLPVLEGKGLFSK